MLFSSELNVDVKLKKEKKKKRWGGKKEWCSISQCAYINKLMCEVAFPCMKTKCYVLLSSVLCCISLVSLFRRHN